MKKILMVTSEAVPFAKTGGLADVVSALSTELKKLGHDVRVLMPRYYHIDRTVLKKHDEALGIWLGRGEEWTAVYEGVLPESEVPVYFLDHERFFGRDGIYGHRADEGFKDNAARYSLLSRGAFQLCRMLHWTPDVVHCHDWPSAPACYLLKREEQDKGFKNTKGILTIHNIGYQGEFSLDDAVYLQPEIDMLNLSTLEFSGALNFLKAGIITADKITTVSPTYAEEIKRYDFGFGMDGLLNYRHEDLQGILNGIDYKDWNPETDKFIEPDNFSVNKISGKSAVKKKLQKEMGLPVNQKIPLVGIVTRLVDQKGIVELFRPGFGTMYSICKDMNVQFVILGSGESWCEEELNHLSAELPNLSVYIGYNNRLAHMIEAGADFFLMPSRYEPCGLNQIYSLSYGTLPIVRNTGGLADTVENYDQEKGTGTGFVFDDLRPDVIYNVMKWVVETWEERREDIRKMRKRAMKKRFSWEDSAREYLKLYGE
ncbi:MAG: glycogen synthase GlgA [Spirochaetales bacterium]|uniref:Glycogen synthase n=1 Tax=Candidatus Thalassospirochaeta sargassi TaxID=3119039 RepID=A0AAJ1IJ53_9SPIO|nr:glycogen synthase GlgA [Spirochaetales bacterium]